MASKELCSVQYQLNVEESSSQVQFEKSPPIVISCQRPVVEGSDKCILHLPRNSPLKDKNKFNEEITRCIKNNSPLIRSYYLNKHSGIDFHSIVTPLNWDASTVLQLPRSSPLFFEQADLSGTSFNRLDLIDCSFFEANLRDCDLYGTDLTGCDLKQSDISNAVLKNCKLKDAITWKMKYNRHTNFSYTDVSHTDWSFNPLLKQNILLYQRKEQLKEDSPFLHFVWQVFGDCGRSISLILSRVLILISIFTGIYYSLIPHWTQLCIYQRFISPLLFSISSFLGLLYEPQFIVTESINIVAIIEGLFGFLMLAVFVAVFLGRIQD
jgi:hypothetical protein